MSAWAALGIAVFCASSASPALGQRFPFERTFEVNGPPALDVSTVRGKIQLTSGEPGRITVIGTVTVRVGLNVPPDAEDLARKVAANPPIQRDGQTLRLRPPSGSAEQRAVTVSYQVRVPPGTRITAVSESGAIAVRDVTGAVVIRTQSGAIEMARIGPTAAVTSGSGSVTVDHAAGSLAVTTNSSSFTGRWVTGDLRVRTKSGAVDATLSGEGNADVETSSSAIRLSGVRGAVAATSQSGHISLQGLPRQDWVASTGSGSVEIATASSVPLRVDASSGSGSVKVVGASVDGSVAKRKVVGSIAGGGPLLKVASRSGSIVVRFEGN